MVDQSFLKSTDPDRPKQLLHTSAGRSSSSEQHQLHFYVQRFFPEVYKQKHSMQLRVHDSSQVTRITVYNNPRTFPNQTSRKPGRDQKRSKASLGRAKRAGNMHWTSLSLHLFDHSDLWNTACFTAEGLPLMSLWTWKSLNISQPSEDQAPQKPNTWRSFAGLLKVKPLVVWKRNPSKPKGLRV